MTYPTGPLPSSIMQPLLRGVAFVRPIKRCRERCKGWVGAFFLGNCRPFAELTAVTISKLSVAPTVDYLAGWSEIGFGFGSEVAMISLSTVTWLPASPN